MSGTRSQNMSNTFDKLTVSPVSSARATVAQLVEQLIRNQSAASDHSAQLSRCHTSALFLGAYGSQDTLVMGDPSTPHIQQNLSRKLEFSGGKHGGFNAYDGRTKTAPPEICVPKPEKSMGATDIEGGSTYGPHQPTTMRNLRQVQGDSTSSRLQPTPTCPLALPRSSRSSSPTRYSLQGVCADSISCIVRVAMFQGRRLGLQNLMGRFDSYAARYKILANPKQNTSGATS